ncbi:cytochrome P450 CYP82D47-like [Cucumis melo var. makuwa]|uniref:Cytochrome P450 CYP82D47-like n=1 Tax=Cucumis melo var. makuwa TaxID=1194695 RepID=A0A5A7UT85_CUCMM|nr:cytochrome P450 CYP82D47-like [Cucumis melo var. makuwa]TYK21193.1 cytochrome P450 CYP82D47-like [Cucumis melo var. makuwa]
MVERDSRCTTQNSGVMVINESSGNGSGDSNFCGVLDEVFDIQYLMGQHNNRIWDVSEVEDVENEQLNVLEIVVEHHVDEHIEDDTWCRPDVDPTISCIMSSFLNGFKETDALFLEFNDKINNATGSSSIRLNPSDSYETSTVSAL